MQKKTFDDGFEVFSVQRDYTKVTMLRELRAVAAFVIVIAGLVLLGVIFK